MLIRGVVVAALVLAPADAAAEDALGASGEERAGSGEDVSATVTPKKKRKKRPRSSGGSIRLRAETTAGLLTGEGTVRDAGAFFRGAVDLTPRFDHRRWRFELPVEASERETVGAAFVERTADVAGRVRWRRDKQLQVTATSGVDGTWRPRWADPYQPMADDTLARSSRRSHVDGHAGVELEVVPFGDQRVELQYEVRRIDYLDDDSFDPIDEPTHLVPADQWRHDADASWTHDGDRWKLGGAIGASYRTYDIVHARDAGSGKTHAGAGGAPPNPLQRLLVVEPSLSVAREGERVAVKAAYGVPVQEDLFQGYYSYVEHHPELDINVELGRTTFEAGVDLRWRMYGPNSYAVDPPDHPMLDWGTLRNDRTLGADAGLRHALGGGFGLVGGAALRVRRTNFPDYVPGVFPDTRQYAIDWDYDDVTVWAGFDWRTPSKRAD